MRRCWNVLQIPFARGGKHLAVAFFFCNIVANPFLSTVTSHRAAQHTYCARKDIRCRCKWTNERKKQKKNTQWKDVLEGHRRERFPHSLTKRAHCECVCVCVWWERDCLYLCGRERKAFRWFTTTDTHSNNTLFSQFKAVYGYWLNAIIAAFTWPLFLKIFSFFSFAINGACVFNKMLTKHPPSVCERRKSYDFIVFYCKTIAKSGWFNMQTRSNARYIIVYRWLKLMRLKRGS